MKKNEIKVGSVYSVKVSGKATLVRVLDISYQYSGTRQMPRYVVVDISTGVRTTVNTSKRFLSPAGPSIPPATLGTTERPSAAVGRFAEEEDPCRPDEVGGDEGSDPPTSVLTVASDTVPSSAPEPTEGEKGPDPQSTKKSGNDSKSSGGGPTKDTVPLQGGPPSEPNTGMGSVAVPFASSSDSNMEPIEGDLHGQTAKRLGTDRETAKQATFAEQYGGPPVSGFVAKMKEKQKEAAEAEKKAARVRESGGSPPHLIVRARAGTGKTTTIIEGLKALKGLPTKIIPSPQQAEIWESLLLSKDANSIGMVAFNKSIATELQARVPPGCDAMTMHSLGFKAINRAFSGVSVNQYRVGEIVAEVMNEDLREVRRKYFGVLKAIDELVALCKQNLTEPADKDDLNGLEEVTIQDCWDYSLDRLVSHHNIELDRSRRKVFDLVPQVLERCRDVSKDRTVDFNDMPWLPVVLNLPLFRYDLLLIDESQDLNRGQQALAKKAGHRLVFVGDDRQSLYGFAGADSESLDRLHRELGETEAGCEILPLTVTRRCGKAIVNEARKIVGDFEAHESNPEGRVREASYPLQKQGKDTVTLPDAETYIPMVEDSDYVVCRVNAPLVSQCFKFLKMGRKANIQGRDIGQGLISLIKKQFATSVPHLLGKMEDWAKRESDNENVKRNPSESRLIAIQDRVECITCFTEGATSVEAVIAKIETVFTDVKNGPGITLSSIHKVKGLEARRVFFLRPFCGPCPHPMARGKWQQEQEMNCLYVGITRAIEELIFVY